MSKAFEEWYLVEYVNKNGKPTLKSITSTVEKDAFIAKLEKRNVPYYVERV